jgi:outer membrane protein
MLRSFSKRFSFLATLFLLIFVIARAAPCDEIKKNMITALSLSLKDAIQIALLNNKDIQIQAQQIDSAKANIVAAQGQFLPTADLSYGYTYSGEFPKINSALFSNSKKDPSYFFGYQNNNVADFSANQVVYNGGANSVNLKQSRINLKIQGESLRAKKLEVEFEAKRLFYGLLLAYETERITQNLLDQANAHYVDVKSKFEQGTVSKFDVLQSKVQVSKVMPEVVRARNDIDIIKAELKKLLSLKMQDAVNIGGKLDCTFIDINQSAFLSEAYSRNPQMILKLLGVDMTKWGIEFARAGYGPMVNANFDYNFKSNNTSRMFNYKHSGWSAGATVTIPVFDGFSTKAKVDEARVKYNQAGLEKENVSDQIAVDITRSCLDLKESSTIIDYEKDSIEEAKEALKIANIGYDNGVMTNLDVLDSQVSLSQVERSLANGIYDYLIAKAFLDKTMGKEFSREG